MSDKICLELRLDFWDSEYVSAEKRRGTFKQYVLNLYFVVAPR